MSSNSSNYDETEMTDYTSGRYQHHDMDTVSIPMPKMFKPLGAEEEEEPWMTELYEFGHWLQEAGNFILRRPSYLDNKDGSRRVNRQGVSSAFAEIAPLELKKEEAKEKTFRRFHSGEPFFRYPDTSMRVALLFIAVVIATTCGDFSSQIPALTEFYRATNGSSWLNRRGWFESNNPCDGTWFGIECQPAPSPFSYLGMVANLTLQSNNLIGQLPLEGIPFVVVMNLSDNALTGRISPSSFWFGTVALDLSQNRLIGQLPDMSGWALLRYVNLRANYFVGTIPDTFSKLTSLAYVDLSDNALYGGIPSSLGLSSLAYLSAFNNLLNSTIPTSLCHTSLQLLDLSDNLITGEIPPCVGQLSNLQALTLNSNDLYGTIPDSIYGLTQLEALQLGNNRLTGGITAELRNMTSLLTLELNDNQLTGNLPEFSSPHPTLVNIKLENNRFYGTLPPSFLNHPELRSFSVSHNLLGGPIPINNTYQTKLTTLLYDHNQFEGMVAAEAVTEFPTLQILVLVLNYLYHVDFSHNQFNGSITSSYPDSPALQYVDLSHNLLSGKLSDNIRYLTQLSTVLLSNNFISGRLPAAVGQLTRLQILDISDNLFIGPLPSSIGSLTSLTLLNASGNLLTSLDSSVSRLQQLSTLDVSDNQLTLDLSAIAKLSQLQVCILSNNHISGSLPVGMVNMVNLKVFEASNNLLYGGIPVAFFSLRSLRSIDLSFNSLSGPFLSLQSDPQVLDISHNNLTGDVRFLNSLSSAQYVDLSDNHFTGFVPLLTQKNLLYLDVSVNELSGNFPTPSLPSLTYIDLHSNRFNGSAPSMIECDRIESIDYHDNSIDDASVFIGPNSIVQCDMKDLPLQCPMLSRLADLCGAKCKVTNEPQIPTSIRMRINGSLSQFDSLEFLKRVANVTESSVDRFSIIGLSEGSVIVDMMIHPASPSQLQQGTPDRLVYRLVHTSETSWNSHNIFPLDFSSVPPTQSSLSGGAIAGIVIGVSVSTTLAIGLLVFYLWRKRRISAKMAEIELQNHLGSMMLDEVHFSSIIGSGQFGEVWKGQWNGTVVALKGLKTETQDNSWIDEIVLVQKLNHPNIVRLLGVCKRNEVMFMVLEYAESGSLDSLLVQHSRENFLDEGQLLNLVMDVARGMMYLSKRGVIHRDLAARNILVDGSCHAKISDFGMSRETTSYHLQSKMIPFRWTAPEVLRQQAATVKSDVWSFGIVCWEIFSKGLLPYADLSNMEVVEHTLRGYTLSQPEGCPAGLFEIMSACWQMNPVERPTFLEIRNQILKRFPDVFEAEEEVEENRVVETTEEHRVKREEDQTYSPMVAEQTATQAHYSSLTST
ncbi:putative leucine-rich repeat receptor-like protein kinase [Planoprotostelium fungivorum]|uniref:Putative leucine-rich repeat receptor-like protein kinase n=1 Tax=Planoprotostelium fungivorum TaxID=1890364 RepID=A0A2P6NRU6_9EUKA|nr:putative leucine-rich repeat receptor-like protein kinase [Planoprotostelium fungivorum]